MRLKEAVEDAKRKAIREAMEASGNCVKEAAKILGINRTSLHRLLERFPLGSQRPRGNRGNEAWRAMQ